MKIHPHYSGHQMGAGPKVASFAAECREAEETLTCLACVCVTELQRDGGGEGYQWATAGVSQSQPFYLLRSQATGEATLTG